MPDADAHSAVVLAAMRVDRLDPVVPASATPFLDAKLAGRKVELVIKHDQVFGLELIETQRLADRLAGKVHIGLGLHEKHLLGPEPALADEGVECLRPGRKGMAASDRIRRHEADIVAVAGILPGRAAKPRAGKHGRGPPGTSLFLGLASPPVLGARPRAGPPLP